MFPIRSVNLDEVIRISSIARSLFKQGDYVFINSGPPTHGFLLVGFGPALECEAPELRSTYLSGERVIVDVNTSNLIRSQDGSVLSGGVPYVVDWGLQRDRARPFYCSRIAEPQSQTFFNHSYWNFIRIPDTTEVPCDFVYDPDFTVDAVGNIR